MLNHLYILVEHNGHDPEMRMWLTSAARKTGLASVLVAIRISAIRNEMHSVQQCVASYG